VAVSTTCVVASITVAGFVVGTTASEVVTAAGSAAEVEATGVETTGVETTGVETSDVAGAAVDAGGVEASQVARIELSAGVHSSP
jgi:hypothetical protein